MANWFRRFDDWLERPATPKPPPVTTSPVDLYREQEEIEQQMVYEQIKLAEAAKDEYRAKYAEEDAEATAAFKFSCSRDGAFLRIEAHGQAWVVNTAFLQRVDLRPGTPPNDEHGRAIATASFWQPIDHRQRWRSYGMRYTLVLNFPEPARDAEITFIGVDLSLSTPHSLGQTVYDQIIDTVAKGTDQ